MNRIKKIIFWFSGILLTAYFILCLGYYFLQEKFLFTHRGPHTYNYSFDGKFTEHNIHTKDGKTLNGLIFKADSSRGLIFYLHGGGHTLQKWGKYGSFYTRLNYDIYFLDYRGFGKSEGSVPSEKQLYGDVQDAYDDLKTIYPENKIIILGYSLGTGPAAKLASENNPKMLLLQAPYYSGSAAVSNNYHFIHSIIPSFLLKYKLPTYQFLQKTKAPVVIIHGKNDSTFSIQQAYRLKEYFKQGDELIGLDHQGHNGFTENPEYKQSLIRIFSKN